MSQLESLYVVWELEPDYALKSFIEIYGSFNDFVHNYKPSLDELIKASKINGTYI